MSEAEKFFWLSILEADRSSDGGIIHGVSEANNDRAETSYSYLESLGFIACRSVMDDGRHSSWRRCILTSQGQAELAGLSDQEPNIIEAARLFADSINERQLFEVVRRKMLFLIADQRISVNTDHAEDFDVNDDSFQQKNNMDAPSIVSVASNGIATVDNLLATPLRKLRAAFAGVTFIGAIALAGDVLGLLSDFFSLFGM